MAQEKVLVKITSKVGIPFNEINKDYIPHTIEYKDDKHLLEGLAIAINENIPTLLIGETGTGKTSLVRFLASITGNGFRRVNHNGATTVDDIVGKILVNKEGTFWVDGVLIDAMRKGHWYLADEINASSADILFIYHCLLDDDACITLVENDGEIVKRHPDFRFFATMNPAGDYSGVKDLNKALMSRFLVFKVDFPSPKTEKEILVERTGIDASVADKMVNFAGEIRMSTNNKKTSYVLSTRDLLMWATMFTKFERYIPSAEISIMNKVPTDDFNAIETILGLHFKTIDENLDKPKVTNSEQKAEQTATESMISNRGRKMKRGASHADFSSRVRQYVPASIIDAFIKAIDDKKITLTNAQITLTKAAIASQVGDSIDGIIGSALK